MAGLPLAGVRCAVGAVAAFAGAAGSAGALLTVVVMSAGGDGGVGRWHGRLATCPGGGGGCVRSDGGVVGGDVVDGDAMVDGDSGGALFFSCKE